MEARRTAWTVGALALALVGLACGYGCRSSEHYRLEAERLFAEAEELRLAYEREASEQAIGKYRDALADWDWIGDEAQAARAGQGVGDSHWQLGELEDALQAYLEAAALSQEGEDSLLESRLRSRAGVAYAYLAELDSAREECGAALELSQQIGSEEAEAGALVCLGEADYLNGDSKAALDLFRQAEEPYRRADDTAGLAQALYLLGSAHTDLNELDRAVACLDEALSAWTEVGDKRGRALTLNALGRVRYLSAQYQEALNQFTESRDLFRTAGDTISEAGSITGIAAVYDEMGEGRDALTYWLQALDRFETAGLQMASVEVLVYVGDAYLASDVPSALGWLEEALALAEASGNRHFEAYALRYLGIAHLELGEPAVALDYSTRSLEVQEYVEDPRVRALTLAEIGRGHEALGDFDAARTYLDRALALSRVSRDRVGEAVELFSLARVSRSQGALDAAQDYVERALEVAESLRTEVESQDLRASYFDSVHDYHMLHVDVLMQLHEADPETGQAAVAFGASERARARSLLESLAEAGVDLRAGVDTGLLADEEELQAEFDDWSRRQVQSGEGEAEALAAEYRELEDRYEQIQARIRSVSPHYAALTQPQPLGLEEVQQEVLDDDTLLLEYALGEERSFLWAVSKSDYASYELAPRAEVEQLAQDVYDLLTKRLSATGSPRERRSQIDEADSRYWQEAARLSDMLLGPVAATIPGKRILVVTEGALLYLPFAALPVPGRTGEPVPMAAEHEIVNLPSASAMAVLRRETSDREPAAGVVAVLADPVFEADDPRLLATVGAGIAVAGEDSPSRDAPSFDPDQAPRGLGFLRGGELSVPRLAATRQEASSILELVPAGTTLMAIDFRASRATAMSGELAQYRIVHFATHGVLDNEDPGRSGVLLSMFDEQGERQDGYLRLHDIYNLELPAELVVLSACGTALGQHIRGEGLVWLVRGFMYAGAERVVASLWNVDDDATRELMSQFYRQMFEEDLPPAAALRQAQLAVWQQDRWRAPFYWAAFVLQGDWR